MLISYDTFIDIFRLVDTVGILTVGETVFYGPTATMVPYFTQQGHPCPHYANPLDHYSKYKHII